MLTAGASPTRVKRTTATTSPSTRRYRRPSTNSAHLFANTTLVGDADRKPLLRILTDKQTAPRAGDTDRKPLKIWNWVSIERMVADNKVVTGTNTNGSEIRSDTGTIIDKVVRVVACDASKGTTYLETNCRAYKDSKGVTNYKPGGLLQEFGEQDLMKFGLITGTYAKNTDGGVVRKNMGSIKSEIYSDGTFKDTDGKWRSTNGIIRTLSLLRTTNFNGTYGCGWIVSGADLIRSVSDVGQPHRRDDVRSPALFPRRPRCQPRLFHHGGPGRGK